MFEIQFVVELWVTEAPGCAIKTTVFLLLPRQFQLF